jgi:hypothetical protein
MKKLLVLIFLSLFLVPSLRAADADPIPQAEALLSDMSAINPTDPEALNFLNALQEKCAKYFAAFIAKAKNVPIALWGEKYMWKRNQNAIIAAAQKSDSAFDTILTSMMVMTNETDIPTLQEEIKLAEHEIANLNIPLNAVAPHKNTFLTSPITKELRNELHGVVSSAKKIFDKKLDIYRGEAAEEERMAEKASEESSYV